MTVDEANALLDSTQRLGRLCKVNKALTVAQAVEILKRAVNNPDPESSLVKDGVLDIALEYRVKQVHHNRVRV